MNELVFVVPGRLDQLTGGYLYDRHIVEGLRVRGRAVSTIELPPSAAWGGVCGGPGRNPRSS